MQGDFYKDKISTTTNSTIEKNLSLFHVYSSSLVM